MEIVIIRTRVLTETASRLWIAVSGTLSASTRHRLHQQFRAHADRGYREFFLDLRELRCADRVTAEDVRKVFSLGSAMELHFIGAPAEIRTELTGCPHVHLYADLASAWERWT
ncbi:hypothetical protein [Streptomyces sp. NPDC001286]